MNKQKTIIVVAGPTAVGKSAIALELAQYYKTAILSADSRQSYKGMAIGTAQPSLEEQALVPHYFINEFEPEIAFNAGMYETYALRTLETLFQSHDVVIVCGGTGLYIKALCEGIDEMPSTDRNIENEIHAEFETKGLEWLQQTVAEEDPAFWAIAEQQNHGRLIRGLAFYRTNHNSIANFRTGVIKERPFNIIKIGIDMPREALYERINFRVDQMMQQGLMDEVGALFSKRTLKNLQTVGYSEFYEFGYWPLNEADTAMAVEKVKQHSRNYAKRQLTWFRKDTSITWFHPNDITAIKMHLKEKIS